LEVNRIKSNLSNFSPSRLEFERMLHGFLNHLRDGHTRILPTNEYLATDAWLPFQCLVIPNGLLLGALPSKHQDLLGSRLIGINGLSTDVLAERASAILPSENQSGAYLQLSYLINKTTQLGWIIGTKGPFVLNLLTANKQQLNLTLQPQVKPPIATELVSTAQSKIKLPNDYLGFTYLDDAKSTMLFRLGLMQDRSTLQEMFRINPDMVPDFLNMLYRQWKGQAAPKDQVQAIQDLPLVSETFRTMLLSMKADKASNLIIDLRRRGGGNSGVGDKILKMLYGSSEVARTNANLISPLVLMQRGFTLEKYNQYYGTSLAYGDLHVIKEFDNLFPDKPIYTPRVIVLVDESTFSASFDLMFALWRNGAQVVGVPPSQSPNCFIEIVQYTMSSTGLQAWISTKVMQYLPIDNNQAKTFIPNMMPDYEIYKHYNFDPETPLLMVLDRLRVDPSQEIMPK
jgi:hypothetical protein